jgi:hypothetical protein
MLQMGYRQQCWHESEKSRALRPLAEIMWSEA